MSNVQAVCKSCFVNKIKNFQNTEYIDTLKMIQRNLDLEKMLGLKNQKRYLAEIPFQNLKREFNQECECYFYINKFNNPEDITEGMWIIIMDVNFEEKTICGILVNEPVNFNLEFRAIVRADFKDIMDIQIME